MFETVIGIVVLILVVMIVKTVKEPAKKQDIALEALSTIWTRHKNITLSLEQIARLWREMEDNETKVVQEEMSFSHRELQDFYESTIKGRAIFVNSGAYSIIQEIMRILDTEGDAPSVVNTDEEPERHIDKSAYDALARVTLVQHTVNVAREMCSMFKTSPMIMPKAVVAALGHDLGKLPSYRKKLYNMGDHPLMSITILESIEGYKSLPFKDEVNKAIKDHHRNPKDMLGEKLKEADQNARRYEMSLYLKKAKTESEEQVQQMSEAEEYEHTAAEPVTEKPSPSGGNGHRNNGDSSKREDIFITHSEEEKEYQQLQEVDLEWFNADEFLAELKPYINKLTGKRWQAFSMKNGYVYFQISVLEEVLKKLGRKYKDENVMMMDMDRGLKRNMVYTVVNLLKREKDAIARGLIKDGFMGGYFVVRMKDGKEYRAYYTPFNAEAFAESVSELEILKVGRLKDIEDVYPYIESEEGV